VRWLLRREAASALLTEPFQASPPAMRLARLTEGDCAEAAYVVEDRPGGHPRIYRGAGAVAYTLRSLPGPRYVLWRLLGRSYFMPGLRQVEDAVYLLIARNRGRLSRACRLQQR
jgi:predicted DCC family thiol-disulfide oxidoreductase YuxK